MRVSAGRQHKGNSVQVSVCYGNGGPLSFFLPPRNPQAHLEEMGMILY